MLLYDSIRLRRMPTGLNPITAHQQRNWIVVEVQSGNRGSADWRDANNSQSILGPLEMIRPTLLPRIEQWCFSACCGIGSGNSIGLVTVANGTSEPDIGLFVSATRGAWEDMFEFERRQYKMLRTEAITTAVSGCLANAADQFDGQVIMRHDRRAGAAGLVPPPP